MPWPKAVPLYQERMKSLLALLGSSDPFTGRCIGGDLLSQFHSPSSQGFSESLGEQHCPISQMGKPGQRDPGSLSWVRDRGGRQISVGLTAPPPLPHCSPFFLPLSYITLSSLKKVSRQSLSPPRRPARSAVGQRPARPNIRYS